MQKEIVHRLAAKYFALSFKKQLKMKAILVDIMVVFVIGVMLHIYTNVKRYSTDVFRVHKMKMLPTISAKKNQTHFSITFIKPYQLCVKHF
jgi:hypothetical protein